MKSQRIASFCLGKGLHHFGIVPHQLWQNDSTAPLQRVSFILKEAYTRATCSIQSDTYQQDPITVRLA